MSIETAQEREQLSEQWGDELITATGARIPGWFDRNRAMELGLEGNVPAFGCLASALTDAGIVAGTADLTVERHDGATFGPYTAVSFPEAETDGAFVVVALELQ